MSQTATSRMHTFEIVLPTQGHAGKVVMDGVELKGVTGVVAEAYVHGLARVSIDFIPDKILLWANDVETVAKIQELAEPGQKQDVTSMGDRFRIYHMQPKPEPIVERYEGKGEKALQAAIQAATADMSDQA